MRRLRLLTLLSPWLVAIAFALVCVGSSRADDKSGLISKIEDKLEDAADALERLPDESGDSALERARGYVAEARRYADELAKIAGDDSSARRLADDFDDLQDDFNDSVNDLRQLKANQRAAEPVAARCVERERDLIRKDDEYEARNDPDGLTELPKLATAAQEETKRALEDLRRLDDRMDDLSDHADDFRGDGPWRELVSTVAQTARRELELWRKGQEATARTCENLARGVEHPDVKDVLAKLASTAGGRKSIIDQIERDARDLASALGNVSEDSGMGSLERAKGHLASIERGLDSLARTPTTDKQTKLLLEKWPDGVRQFKEAFDDLEDLKVHQHDMDALPDKCEQKKRELADAIARNGDDTDGIEELPKLAEAIAEPVRGGLAKAADRMREENDDLGRATAISISDGLLGEARAAAQRDAGETHRTYKDNYEKTTGACDEVVKGRGGRVVTEAIERLRRGGASAGDTLDRDVANWLEAARGTYILDCKAMETMWQAYCGTDFEPGDDGADGRAKQIAAQVQDDMQRKMGPLLKDLESLEPRVVALAKKRETRSRGENLQALIGKEKARLGRLQNQGTWRGNNHPMIQNARQYGQDRHRAEWRSLGCMVPTTDTGYAVFDGHKPDCIIARNRQCEIIEIKPRSDSGERDAAEQIADYQDVVPSYYDQLYQRGAVPDSSHGGSEFMAALKQHCIVDGHVKLEARPHYYVMCEKQYVCE